MRTVTIAAAITANAGADGDGVRGSLWCSCRPAVAPSEWWFPGRLSGPERRPLAAPTATTSYGVVTDANGRRAKRQVVLTVQPLPVVSGLGRQPPCASAIPPTW